MEKADLFRVRDYTPSDDSLIYSSWLKGYRHGNDWMAISDAKAYYKAQHDIIEMLLKTCSVKIAHHKDDKDSILGYSVSSGETLHWVFVKTLYRGQGIAKALTGEFSTVTHLTKTGVSYLSRNPKIIFNPFILGDK